MTGYLPFGRPCVRVLGSFAQLIRHGMPSRLSCVVSFSRIREPKLVFLFA
jgi:hypothetical protein